MADNGYVYSDPGTGDVTIHAPAASAHGEAHTPDDPSPTAALVMLDGAAPDMLVVLLNGTDAITYKKAA